MQVARLVQVQVVHLTRLEDGLWNVCVLDRLSENTGHNSNVIRADNNRRLGQDCSSCELS